MKRNMMIAISSILIIVVVVSAISIYLFYPQPPTSGGTLVVGLKREGLGLDPCLHAIADDNSYNWPVYERLVNQKVTAEHEVELIPGLATSWEVYNTTAYKFTLRQGVQFQCGNKFNATAVKYNVDRVLTWNKTYARSMFGPVKYCSVLDEYSVVIGTQSPLSAVLIPKYLSLDLWGMIDPLDAEQYGWDNVVQHPCGTGRFKFVSWTTGVEVVYNRSLLYWGEPAAFDTLIIKIVKEDATRILALETGELDVIDAYTPVQYKKELEEGGFHVEAFPGNRLMMLMMNNQKPPLNDTRIRQAMEWAINRTAITEAIYEGATEPATSIFGFGTFGKTDIEIYGYDPNRSKQLLTEAGFPNGLPEPLHVWATYGNFMKDTEVYQAVFGYLEEVGITVEVEVMDSATLSAQGKDALTKVYNGNMSAADVPFHLVTQSIGDPTFDADYILNQIYNWVEKPGSIKSFVNYAFYDNQEVKELIIAGANEFDENERLADYAQIQDIIVGDAVQIWLQGTPQISAWKTNITGIEVNPTSYMVLSGAHLQ